ncbi:MAG: TM1812 family CRISPR-associated protein, partial [Schwartzia sp.]|nr:TM1812 family CRISPR-associated protein [Schwartzia sp. (in: firmicutes)]
MSEATAGNQERNIMIMFLSNFFPKDTGEGVKTLDRKFEGIYKFHDGTMDSEACTLTNEAPIRDVVASLSHQNRKLDKIVYFVTSALQEEPIKLLDGGRIQEYKTKEDLFLHRIREKCSPALDDTEFVGVPFDDKSTQPMQECIEAVVRMENEIKKNLLTEGKERNHLFADITGGLRTANMAMTAVIQLLQYEKIQVDLVLYSYSSGDIRSVLDVRDVDSLYKLVAGVDAFTKYGSSAALNEYFADVINDEVGYPPLKKMLFVMDKFSASVLLCQTNLIKKNLAKLMRRLYKFMKEKSSGRPAKVELFARMTNELVHRYSKML